MPLFSTTYPAKGKITSLGIGGKTVSSKAARKIPGYRLSEIRVVTHSMKVSISVNYDQIPSSNNVIQCNTLHNILVHWYVHNCVFF
jgi:hypothetical protein